MSSEELKYAKKVADEITALSVFMIKSGYDEKHLEYLIKVLTVTKSNPRLKALLDRDIAKMLN